MKTIKPLQLSVLHRCFEHRGRKLFGVSVLAFLTMEDSPTLLLEAQLWPFLAETLGKDAALEAGMPKGASEFLVFGSAHVPDRQPAPALAVRARFGSVDKILQVTGDRYWDGHQATSPAPFTSMPLDWSRAYGGPAVAANPLGKGQAPIERDGRHVHPLPNIEYLGQQALTPSDVRQPAGFGVIDITWPQRASLVGTYDESWLKTRFPGMADDLDWHHFNVAPRDQWLDRSIAPDEPFELGHLHPTQKVIRGRLPGITCRVFVNREMEGLDLEEIRLTLRTAAFFPDRERVVLIWQGGTRIADEQAADIVHLLVGADQVANPRPVDHYRAVLEKRLDKEKGAFYAMKDSDLTPPGLPLRALAEPKASTDPALTRALERAEKEIQQARATVAGYGLDPDKHAPMIPRQQEESPPPLESLFEFADRKQAEAEALAAEQREWARGQDEAIAATMKGAGQDFDLVGRERTRGQVGPPQYRAKTELDSLRQLADKLRSQGQPVAELDAYAADVNFAKRLDYAEEQIQSAYRMTAHYQTPAPRLAPDKSASIKTAVVAAYQSGHSLAGWDLTGADLSGVDLHGADFAGALLESANLRGARLEGCSFSNAVLARATLTEVVLDRAVLSGTNLGGADLTAASLQGAKLTDAILTNANLSGTVLTDADLSGAELAGATLDGTDFTNVLAPDMFFNETDLNGVILRGARMQKTIFIKCSLDGADLSGADLGGSAFVGVTAVQTLFEGTRLQRCCFVAPSDLSAANFSRADLSGANLRGAALKDAIFESAVLRGCDLSGADLTGSSFYMSDAREARFVKSNLTRALLASANLMNAVLERSVLRGADLRYANLFQADLARVRVDQATRWDGALSKRARTYPRLSPEEMRG